MRVPIATIVYYVQTITTSIRNRPALYENAMRICRTELSSRVAPHIASALGNLVVEYLFSDPSAHEARSDGEFSILCKVGVVDDSELYPGIVLGDVLSSNMLQEMNAQYNHLELI